MRTQHTASHTQVRSVAQRSHTHTHTAHTHTVTHTYTHTLSHTHTHTEHKTQHTHSTTHNTNTSQHNTHAPVSLWRLFVQLLYFLHLMLMSVALLMPGCGVFYLNLVVLAWTATIFIELVRLTIIKKRVCASLCSEGMQGCWVIFYAGVGFFLCVSVDG